MKTVIFLAILAICLLIFIGEVDNRVRWILLGRRDEKRWDRPLDRLRRLVTDVFGQRKLLQRPLPGVMHFAIFWGFLVLTTVSMELIGEGLGLLGETGALPFIGGALLSGLQDVVTAVVFLALSMAVYTRYIKREERVQAHSEFDAAIILVGIYGLLVTFWLYKGSLIAQGLPHAHGELMPFSQLVAAALGPVTFKHELGEVAWWLHFASLMVLLIWIPRGKHAHLLAGPANVLLGRPDTVPSRVEPLAIDLEEMGEDDVLGAGTVTDLTWKQLLDTVACTECGRCQDRCPAFATGKDLSPKQLQIELRMELERIAPHCLIGKTDEEGEGRPLAGEGGVFSDDFLWACNTCRACEYECPVANEHVSTLLEMRRYKAMMEADFPTELIQTFKNLENAGNPWGMADRMEWAKDLDVPLVGDDASELEYLYWVGCAGAFDRNGQKIAQAMVRLLRAANVKFAVLGDEETCTGDTARRLGNEYLYQMMAEANVELLDGKGVKRIVTHCPHCFHALRNEYPDFGGHYEVVHHTVLLEELLRTGRLSLRREGGEVSERVAFHDSCYLGRHNGIYDAPRAVIAGPGVELLELPRSRDRGFCCGAGGGRMWTEEPVEQRVNNDRAKEAIEVRPDVIATACPFCFTMLDDGVKHFEAEDKTRVRDVAQILADRLPG